MDIAWTLTVILCSSVCDARLSQYSNKTVLLIGPAIPETWEEVHILAPNISADADLSSLAAALQKSRVAVSLTSATNMSGDDWFFSSTCTSSAISTCMKTFIFTAKHSSDLLNFFALKNHFKRNKLVSPFSQYIYILPRFDENISPSIASIWVLRGVYNQLVLLRNGRRYRFNPFSIYGPNINILKSFDYPRIPLKMDGSSLTVYFKKKSLTVQLMTFLSVLCRVMRCKLEELNLKSVFFRFDVTSNWNSVGSRTDFDYGPAMFWHCWVAVAPVPKELPPWIQLLLTFSLELWLSIGAASVCFMLVWYTVSRWSWPHKSSSPPSLLGSANHTARVLVAMDWPRSLQDASGGAPQRAMLAGLMLLSLVIVTTFQSSLVDIQQNPRKTKPIDTLEDLQRSGLPIYFAINMTDWDESPVLAKLKKQMHPAMGIRTYDYIHNGAQYAMIDIEHSVSAFYNSYGNGKARLCKEKILCSYSSFNQPFRSPLSEALNIAYLQLAQSSLVPSILVKEVSWSIFGHALKMLTLNDLKPAYYLLLAGLSTSFFVFLFESQEQIKVKLKFGLNYFPFYNCNERIETTELPRKGYTHYRNKFRAFLEFGFK